MGEQVNYSNLLNGEKRGWGGGGGGYATPLS